VKRGEIWWVERPADGRRPYLVLVRDSAIPVLQALVCVPATRTIRGIPSEVELGPDDGMPERCVLSFDNVRVLRKAYFVERICTLGPEKMDRVCRALAIATGCRVA
jgi:mRNA interferase MazF